MRWVSEHRVGLALGVLAISVGTWIGSSIAFDAFSIPSASMEPSLVRGDRMLVRTIGPGPGRGDMVVYSDPDNELVTTRVSRIVGLAGDRIEARGGRVLLDGEPLDEGYLAPGDSTRDFGPVDVPDGRVFLLSDNRGNSADSRIDGPLDRDDLIGTVEVVNVPFDRVAMFLSLGLGLLLLLLGPVRRLRRSRGVD